MCTCRVRGAPIQPPLPALVAPRLYPPPAPSLKEWGPMWPPGSRELPRIGYLEQGRLDALPVHEAPGRGVRGRRAAPQGEVVMVVAVAVVTQR